MSDTALSADQLLPYETAESGDDAESRLFDALGSEPEFQDSEEPDTDEPESEGEEPEDESDDFEEESDDDLDDEADDETEDEPELITVTVAGQELQVSLDELKAGYSRTQDYTRKTQELASKEREELSQLRARREQYGQKLEALESTLTNLMPAEPDWDKLRAEDPTQYLIQRQEWKELQDSLAQVRAERQNVTTELTADQSAQLRESLEAERQKLLEAVPEWSDQEVAKAEAEKIRAYAMERGYSDQDLANITDHRLLLMVRDAMRYRQSQSKGAEIKEKAKKAKVLKPGGRSDRPVSKNKRKAVQRARERLAHSGRADDAAALIEHLMPDD